MKILIASEFRCSIYKGKYYLAPKAYSIYKRYADAFGDVILCSRFEEKDFLNDGYCEATFIKEIINIEKLSEVIVGKYKKEIITKIQECDLVIVRAPSMIAFKTANYAQKKKVPYLLEAMGDAWDSYWNHSIIGKCIAPYMYFSMKKVCRNSNYSIFVTKYHLQKRYPSLNKGINASNVAINNFNEQIIQNRIKRIKNMDPRNISLMTTAGVNVKAKGHVYVIKAIKQLKKEGINVTYYLAGGGNKDYLLKKVKKYKVEKNIVFLGELSMNEVYKYLDNIDIYVQPSLQEGLPRAIIEAMSRACPCIGSKTGGTPELLDNQFIFRRKSSSAIVDAIHLILKSNIEEVAARNYEESKKYDEHILNKKRNLYFQKIKDELEGK